MDLERRSENWIWRPEGTNDERYPESTSDAKSRRFGNILRGHASGVDFYFTCQGCAASLASPTNARNFRRKVPGERRDALFNVELLGIRSIAIPDRLGDCKVVMGLRCPECGFTDLAEIPCSSGTRQPR